MGENNDVKKKSTGKLKDEVKTPKKVKIDLKTKDLDKIGNIQKQKKVKLEFGKFKKLDFNIPKKWKIHKEGNFLYVT